MIRKLVEFVPGTRSLWVLFATTENQEAAKKNCREVFSLSKNTGKGFCLYEGSKKKLRVNLSFPRLAQVEFSH